MSGEQMSFGERMSLGEWERLSRGINRPGTNVRERVSGERMPSGNKWEEPVIISPLFGSTLHTFHMYISIFVIIRLYTNSNFFLSTYTYSILENVPTISLSYIDFISAQKLARCCSSDI